MGILTMKATKDEIVVFERELRMPFPQIHDTIFKILLEENCFPIKEDREIGFQIDGTFEIECNDNILVEGNANFFDELSQLKL